MRFAVLFLLLSLSLFVIAVQHGGTAWLLLWPSANLLIVAIAYFRNDSHIFGKNQHGRLNPWRTLFFLPFLMMLWMTWRAVRLIRRESAFNRVNDQLTIGRRLLVSEIPDHAKTILDLTAEFNSPVDDSSKYRYIAFPILDASTPDIPKLDLLLTDLADVEGLYIHCAEGHGRTGLVASCFILKYGIASNPKEALECIQEHRPLIRLNASQKGCLNEYHRGLHNLGHDSRYELED